PADAVRPQCDDLLLPLAVGDDCSRLLDKRVARRHDGDARQRRPGRVAYYSCEGALRARRRRQREQTPKRHDDRRGPVISHARPPAMEKSAGRATMKTLEVESRKLPPSAAEVNA